MRYTVVILSSAWGGALAWRSFTTFAGALFCACLLCETRGWGATVLQHEG